MRIWVSNKLRNIIEARFQFRSCRFLLNLDGAQVKLKLGTSKRGEKRNISDETGWISTLSIDTIYPSESCNSKIV